MVDDAGVTPDSSLPTLHLLRGTVPGGAVAQLALSQALLNRVAADGEAPLVARLYVPGPTVAFGRVDAFRPGFEAAVRVARDHGFEPVLRAPGGRAAAYHERSLVLELAAAEHDPRAGITDRFAAMAGLVVAALRGLGVDAVSGELPGEYCPGRFSVLAGGVKLGGIAQRVVAGASLVGIAVVVEDGARIRAVLEDVSRALEYDFDPTTAGAVADVAPGVATADVGAAIERALGARYALTWIEADPELLAAARAREPEHAPVARSRTSGPST
jgi:octanoyl-[GcvH]:protein N-octanoyltransferase